MWTDVEKHGWTWLEHAGLSLLFQLACGWMAGDFFWPAAVAIAFFVGRECAQVEDHGRSDIVKCADGQYRRAHVNTLGSLPIGYGLNLLRWSFDGVMDIVVPIVVCGAAWWLLR